MTNTVNSKNVESIENKENTIMTNNERTTIVKGFAVEISGETVVNHPFEIVTGYTRSNATARKLASKALNVDANFIIVTELVNEPKKAVEYDAVAITAYCFEQFDESDKELAEGAMSAYTDATLVKYSYYEYGAQVWSVDGMGDYHTNYHMDWSPLKMTKINARGFIKMSYEDLTGETVLGIHNDARWFVTKYAIVPTDKLEECVK